MHFLTAIAACVALATGAAAERLPRPEMTPAQRKAFEQLLEQLEGEAKQILADEKLEQAEPDVASRYEGDFDAGQIGIALLHRMHDEPFIDAYTRWQLLSFEPVFPELSDAQFVLLLSNTPAMMRNPWSEPRILEMFRRAETAPRLSARDIEQMRALQTELTHREDVAKHLNHPADQFRQWVADQIGETGAKPRLWLLEQCSATIAAGWSTRSIKTRISRNFSDSVADESFTEEQRHMVATVARKLAGFKRQFVSDIAVMANGSVDVRFSTAQVRNSDVENWRNRLFDRVLE